MTDRSQQNRPIALVTGANRGIGLQVARDLVAEGFTVLLGSRSLERGRAAAESIGPDAHAIVLDVTDPATIAAAAAEIGKTYGRLDVLVNNAGIAHVGPAGLTLEEMLERGRPSTAAISEIRSVFETNVFGVAAVTQGLLPLLRAAPAARIVNVSSTVGSLALNSDPAFPYRSAFGAVYGPSKTALNAITLAFALELEPEGIKVNAVCPGFTATELNNYAGHRSVEEGARAAVRMALIGPDGPTGTFSDDNGGIAW